MIAPKIQQTDFDRIINEWLELARRAPSGGNSQPWLVDYKVENEFIHLRLSVDPVYQLNKSTMDVQGVASAIALGSLAQTLVFAAHLHGYGLFETQFVETEDIFSSFVWLKFSPIGINHLQISSEDILKRRTDRYPYKKDPLPDDFISEIQKIIPKYPRLSVRTLDRGASKLEQGLYSLELIRWQHLNFFKSLLGEISAHPSEELSDSKIPINQLGLNLLDQSLFKLIKLLPRLGHLLIKSIFGRNSLKKQINRFVNDCHLIIFLQAKSSGFVPCYELGRCLQEIWLTAQSHGVSMQPNGNGFVALSYWQNEQIFNKQQAEMIKQTTTEFSADFEIDLKLPHLGFRLGIPARQALQSPRKTLTASFFSSERKSRAQTTIYE